MQKVERFRNNSLIVEHKTNSSPICNSSDISYGTGGTSKCECPTGMITLKAHGNGVYPNNYCTDGSMPTVNAVGEFVCPANQSMINSKENEKWWCVPMPPSMSPSMSNSMTPSMSNSMMPSMSSSM